MKTAYYTFTTWNDGAMAAGFDSGLSKERQSALVRQPVGESRAQDGDKVIDLTAWRAANSDEAEDETGDGLEWETVEPDWTDEEPPAPRPRRSRRAMLTAELVSTLSVVAVAAAIIVRVLAF